MDNYYSHRHFWFELDHAQTNWLLSLLSSAAIAPSLSAPQNSAKWRYIFRSLPSSDKSEEGEGFDALDVEYETSSKSKHDQSMEACSSEQVVEEDEKNLMYKKLKELVLSRDRSDLTLAGCGEDTAVVNDVNLEDRSLPGDQTISEEKNDEIPINSSNYPSVIAKLLQEVEELKTFKVEHIYKMGSLEQKLVFGIIDPEVANVEMFLDYLLSAPQSTVHFFFSDPSSQPLSVIIKKDCTGSSIF